MRLGNKKERKFKMDRTIKGLAHEGKVSIIAAETTQMIETIRNLQNLTPTTTAVLGRVATISGMMGLTEIKEKEDSITIQINGKGPVGSVVAVVKRENSKSFVKLYAQNSNVELPLNENGKIAVGEAVGTDGFLNIIKENEFTEKSYNGLVPLVSGEIAEDFTEYFAKSQQKPTVIALGVLVDKNGVRRSGGYMLQLMPDATETEITKIEEAIANSKTVSQMLEEETSLEDIVRNVTGDPNALFLIDDLSIEFKCDCSKERFANGLASIGKEELDKIINEDGKANTKCHFCNQKYDFSKEELEKIRETLN